MAINIPGVSLVWRFHCSQKFIPTDLRKKPELYRVHFAETCFAVFKDKNTKSPFTEDFCAMGDKLGVSERCCKPDHIYMDCMGFGMGCSCLQMTFQVSTTYPLRLHLHGTTRLREVSGTRKHQNAADIIACMSLKAYHFMYQATFNFRHRT